jgi:hypothetical protein
LLYSSYFGGNFNDEATAVAVTSDGPVVAGTTTSTTLPTKAAQQSSLASSGTADGFLARFGSGGSTLLVSTYLGGSGPEAVRGLALDGASNAYVVGNTTSNDFPLVAASPGQTTYQGGGDGFMAGYNALGLELFSGYLGGLDLDQAAAVSVSASGYVSVVGSTRSPDMTMVSATQPAFGGAQDGFVVRFHSLEARGAGVAAASHAHVLALAAACLMLGLTQLRRRFGYKRRATT